MRNIDTSMLISRCEQIQEYRKWCKELPTFNFDK